MDNRFTDMLDRGYEPGKTYGSSPLCACGNRPEYVVRTIGSALEHKCRHCYRKYKEAKAVR